MDELKYTGVTIGSSYEDEGVYHKLVRGSRSKTFFVQKGDDFDLNEGYFEIKYIATSLKRDGKKDKKVNLVTEIVKYDPDFENYLSYDSKEWHSM